MNRVEQLVEEHREALAEEARRAVAEHPAVDFVGVIMDADAPEAAAFFAAVEQQTGQPMRAEGVKGVFPRTMAVEMLKASTPRALEWLESSGPDRLPILVMLKGGNQMTVIPI